MGGTSSSYEPSIDPELDRIDCKQAALRLVSMERNLTLVRGHALVEQGFVQHWWARKRSGQIVDVTGLRQILGEVPQYVSIDKEAPQRWWDREICEKLDGPCGQAPACAWCIGRLALEERGHKRIRLNDLTHRHFVDVLRDHNQRLREDLAALKTEHDTLRDFREYVRRKEPQLIDGFFGYRRRR